MGRIVFELAFMRLALVASIATSVSLGIVGVYLIVRRVAFLGLVLANAATVGAALAQVFEWPEAASAVAASIVAALLLGALPASHRIPSESIMGWAYAAAASATVLILAQVAHADADTLRLLYGNVLAISEGHVLALVSIALAVVGLQTLCGERFLLVTFDPEGAQVAGVHTRGWLLGLNLSIGVATATAVHEIGALLTFSLLTLAPTASLLVTRSMRATFTVSAAVGITAVSLALAGSWHFDQPPGPLAVALLAALVVVAGVVGRWRA
jgi:ABC-type Mn2+/Zn2+ transport system permease subunit